MGREPGVLKRLCRPVVAAAAVGLLLPTCALARPSVQAARAGCVPLVAGQNGVEARGADPGSPNPLSGLTFFNDPAEPALRQAVYHWRRGELEKAKLVLNIARDPKFRWFGRFTRPNLHLKVWQYLSRAQCAQPGSVPLLTVLRHQGKGCGGDYRGGGAAEDARTRRWYRGFAAGVGQARVVIAFEPDSIGTIECLTRSRRAGRIALLRYGVNLLSKLPNATIYLEGGASDWFSARTAARRLRQIGVRKVRGFMLNVTHFDWTARNVAHGRRISRLLGGKPFIVSTAYNGRGPVHVERRIGGRVRRLNVHCNPGYRGLGPRPTTATGQPKVDAYLWIGRPGYSAGACNGGPGPPGTWWPERALMFGKYATEWRRPPAGTRHGHRQLLTLPQLGVGLPL